jgi:2-polyprenyl-3-methyl-5-hydroxy-6-metoxy-1,4-benzoquinol methylase
MKAWNWIAAGAAAVLLCWHPGWWPAAVAGVLTAVAVRWAADPLSLGLGMALACTSLAWRDGVPVLLVAALACVAGLPQVARSVGDQLPVERLRRGWAGLRLSAMLVGLCLLAVLAWPLPAGLELALLTLALAIEVTGDAPRCLAAVGLGAAAAGFSPAGAVLAAAAVTGCAWPPQRPRWLGLGIGATFAVLALGLHQPLVVGLAPVVAAVVWDLLPDAGGAPHRTLPPMWRWFAWCKLRWDPVFSQLAAKQRRFGRVLDVGCGFGVGAWLCARRGDTTAWTGVDLDRGKLRVASRLCGRLRLPCTLHAARVPEFSSPSADTILALDMLHYWPPPDQLVMLRWLASQLAPGGVLYVRDGLREVDGAGLVTAGERFTTAVGLNPRQALHFLSEPEIRELFSQAGLVVAACQPSGGGNRLWELRVSDGQEVPMAACTSALRSRPSTAPAVLQPPINDPRMPG